jgi:hypothetical protein
MSSISLKSSSMCVGTPGPVSTAAEGAGAGAAEMSTLGARRGVAPARVAGAGPGVGLGASMKAGRTVGGGVTSRRSGALLLDPWAGETLVIAREDAANPRCTSMTARGVEVGRLGRGGASFVTRTINPSWLSSTWRVTAPVGPS